MARKYLSKKIRFEVFKRDDFKCVYCWKTPQDDIKLQVDHIIPVAEWWQNEIENLCSACWDCNIGKWKRMLNKKQTNRDLKKEIKEMKEQQEILKEYYQFLSEKNKIKEDNKPYRAVEKVIWYEIMRDYHKTINTCVNKFWLEITIDAWNIFYENDVESWSYLYWIARNMYLKENDSLYQEKLDYYEYEWREYDRKGWYKNWIYENYKTFRYMVENYWFTKDDVRYNMKDKSDYCNALSISTYNLLKYLKESHKKHKEDIEKEMNE